MKLVIYDSEGDLFEASATYIPVPRKGERVKHLHQGHNALHAERAEVEEVTWTFGDDGVFRSTYASPMAEPPHGPSKWLRHT